MKLSKSLLQAMALGLTLGAANTSCSLFGDDDAKPDLRTAQSRLADSSLAGTAWRIEDWEPAMLETAMRIAQKWKRGW